MVGFLGLALLALGREQKLLVRATNTHLNARHWIPAHFAEKPAYFWRSNDSVLFVRLDKNWHAEFVTADVHSGVETVLVPFNTGPGRELPLSYIDGFTRATPTRPSHSTGHYFLPDVRLSPDGTHLLWRKSIGSPCVWSLSTLDGKPAQSWHTHRSYPQETVAVWSPDSTFCVVRSLSPQEEYTERFDVKTGRSETVTQPVLSADFLYDNRPHHLSGLLPDNRLLYAILPQDTTRSVFQIKMRTESLQGSDHKWTLRLPYASIVEEVKLAPQGDRLAFLLRYDSVPPGPVFTRSLWKYLGVHAEPTVGIWICHLDGSDMREVGHVSDRSKDLEDTPDVPRSLNWTPDGERLSFVCNDTLWTIPAQ
jgi:hypothetical protein